MKHDEQLQFDVEQELGWEPSVRAEQIGVSVRNGVVELNGHVGSYFEKWAAERAVLRVANAKAVVNEIKIEVPFSYIKTDEDIARAALNQLEWNHSVPDTVMVEVTDGRVTLKGTTEWQFQKEEAERVVRALVGVKWVFNELTITPKVSAEDVKLKIEAALKRHAEKDAEHITVETTGGNVTLRGQVRTWAEREQAEQAAWAAPGVLRVEDYITIA